jgi:uroporphyrinogen-III decarboxylase
MRAATQNRGQDGDRLADFDFEQHNAEVREVWAAYRAGTPVRIPIILGTNTRYFLREPTANPEGLNFRRYSESPDVMFEAQLRHTRWSRFNLLQDAELGMPERWQIGVDFQNYYEAAWFGCPLAYYDGEVPDTQPVFADCPERVMERGLPDPFGGLMAKGLDYYAHFLERAGRETFLDRPIAVNLPGFGMGSDGPLTVACNLFGPVFVCTAMASEPTRLHRLLDFITEATIRRIAAWRQRFNVPTPSDGYGLADDSIALISTRMYREHVLPYHRRIYETFGTQKGRGIHLCGDATRHFKTLRDELDIQSFDTGFPVDFGRLRRELGTDVQIQGGPHIEILRTGTPEQVRAETRRILQSGVLVGGRFVLREGNNLAPGTPLENIEAMYHTGRAWGRLQAAS